MTDYTPTQDEVRDDYAHYQVRQDEVGVVQQKIFFAGRAEFDRWLALHDAELLERTRIRIEQSFDHTYAETDTADDYEFAHAEGYRHRDSQVFRVLDLLRDQETK